MAGEVSRCPFCMVVQSRGPLLKRLRASLTGRQTCSSCGRSFHRRLGRQVAALYDDIVTDFKMRLAEELKNLPIVDRAEVLVKFGMHMEDAQVASVEMLFRALTQTLEPQLAGLARGYEGHLDIRRVEKGTCACCDIDVMVEDGNRSRRRLRIARIEVTGFIQVDLNRLAEPAGRGKQIAR